MTDRIFETKDEAIAAAIAASSEDGVVIVHQSDCKIVGDDESTCSCHPITLQLGASA